MNGAMTFDGHRNTLLAILMLAAIAPRTRAQGAAPADTVMPVKFTANLGLAAASGNTNVTTITAGDELIWKRGSWGLKQVFALIYGKSNGVETANQWGLGLRGDYALSKRWALYLGARYDRNRFAGYDSRVGEDVGVIWNAVVAPKDKLDLEAGFGLTQQQDTSGLKSNFPNGRFAAIYRHTFKEKTYFQETAVALPDLKDSQNLRLNSLTELIAPISGSIAMRFSYLVQYDRQPADTSIKTTDQLLTAGLQFSF